MQTFHTRRKSSACGDVGLSSLPYIACLISSTYLTITALELMGLFLSTIYLIQTDSTLALTGKQWSFLKYHKQTKGVVTVEK
ncbi:hypothetical protein VNO80_09976 [Phaseolus coccineus]|uniref:Uncharacterized protein n=1 Tax=Phaseolus coccineus TaxID=3886 RepID=A0AAN9RD25_PHACN